MFLAFSLFNSGSTQMKHRWPWRMCSSICLDSSTVKCRRIRPSSPKLVPMSWWACSVSNNCQLISKGVVFNFCVYLVLPLQCLRQLLRPSSFESEHHLQSARSFLPCATQPEADLRLTSLG